MSLKAKFIFFIVFIHSVELALAIVLYDVDNNSLFSVKYSSYFR